MRNVAPIFGHYQRDARTGLSVGLAARVQVQFDLAKDHRLSHPAAWP